VFNQIFADKGESTTTHFQNKDSLQRLFVDVIDA
jgi:hypothetical protein